MASCIVLLATALFIGSVFSQDVPNITQIVSVILEDDDFKEVKIPVVDDKGAEAVTQPPVRRRRGAHALFSAGSGSTGKGCVYPLCGQQSYNNNPSSSSNSGGYILNVDSYYSGGSSNTGYSGNSGGASNTGQYGYYGNSGGQYGYYGNSGGASTAGQYVYYGGNGGAQYNNQGGMGSSGYGGIGIITYGPGNYGQSNGGQANYPQNSNCAGNNCGTSNYGQSNGGQANYPQTSNCGGSNCGTSNYGQHTGGQSFNTQNTNCGGNNCGTASNAQVGGSPGNSGQNGVYYSGNGNNNVYNNGGVGQINVNYNQFINFIQCFTSGQVTQQQTTLVHDYYRPGSFNNALVYFQALPLKNVVVSGNTYTGTYHSQQYTYVVTLCKSCYGGYAGIRVQCTARPYSYIYRRFIFVPAFNPAKYQSTGCISNC
ncbi:hypothetical protein SNE40_005566 [Patella caerulea]|uniref:Uncharacterized protein n=1 Tax=Patella caerulea TaxID=87958 RepID=A0AAN8K8F5_PATCE